MRVVLGAVFATAQKSLHALCQWTTLTCAHFPVTQKSKPIRSTSSVHAAYTRSCANTSLERASKRAHA